MQLEALSGNFQHIFVIQQSFLVTGGSMERCKIRSFEGGERVKETIRYALASVKLVLDFEVINSG